MEPARWFVAIRASGLKSSHSKTIPDVPILIWPLSTGVRRWRMGKHYAVGEDLDPRATRERQRCRSNGRNGGNAIHRMVVPAHTRGQMQHPGERHPGLLRVAALARRRAIGAVEQARQRRVGLVLIADGARAQAAQTLPGVERRLFVPHPSRVRVPHPLAVISGAKRKLLALRLPSRVCTSRIPAERSPKRAGNAPSCSSSSSTMSPLNAVAEPECGFRRS